MKKIFSFILIIVLISTASIAQTITNNDRLPNIITKSKKNTNSNANKSSYFTEDFESGSLPIGWTSTQGAASTGWLFGDSLGSSYWVIPNHTKYAATNDDICHCNMSDVFLYTPLIDLSSVPNPSLSFEYIFSTQYGGTTSIKVSLDSGLTWTTVDTLIGNTAWQTKTINLSNYANTDSVMIGFHYNDNGQWAAGVAIDNILVEDGASSADLVSNITGFVSEYYSQPMDQAIAFTPEGRVNNIGLALTTATNFTLTAGTYSNSQAITTPLSNSGSEDFTFSSFTPTEDTITFSYNADYSGDYDTTNNISSKDIVFGGAELRRDNGIFGGYIGISSTNAGGEMGNVFTISSQDTITSIKWVMKGTAGDTVTAIIRNFNNTPTTEVGRTISVISTGIDTANYEGLFAAPVILPPGKYFIGLIEGAGSLGLEYTTTPFIDSTAWAYFNNVWNNLGSMNFKHTYNIRPQFNNTVPVYDDIAMVSINIANVVSAGNINIEGTIRNMSNQKILTSYDVVYSINNGATSAVYSVTGIAIIPGEVHDFTHNVLWNATAGTHNIEISVSNPNGITDEDSTNNDLSKSIIVASQLFPKTVVYEEGTGTWCGWCVRGLVGLNTMAHNITDGSWIGIAVHNGDPMTVADYDAVIGTYISGYPSGIADRYSTPVDPGLANLQAIHNEHLSIPTIAKIEITTKSYNHATRDWTIDVASTFGMDLSNADYNTALIIVENGVTGSGVGWSQHNYYAGGGAGDMIDYDGTNYANLPTTVPASEMVYNHVGRELVDGFNGSANSVPTTITDGIANSFSYSGTLDTTWDENNISFVALLIDNNTNQIVNATEVELLSVGINEISDVDYSIFPNPTTGIITIKGAQDAQITVYNMIGNIVYQNNKAEKSTQIDLSNLSTGSYVIRIINNNKVITKKIILSK